MNIKLILLLLLIIQAINIADAKTGNLTVIVENCDDARISVWGNGVFINKTGNYLVFKLPLNATYHILLQQNGLSLFKRVDLKENLTLKFNLKTTNVEKVLDKKIHTILYTDKFIEVHEVLILKNVEDAIFHGDVKVPLPKNIDNFKTGNQIKYELEQSIVVFKNITVHPNSTLDVVFSYNLNSNNFSRNVNSIDETIIFVQGIVKDKSPFLISQGIRSYGKSEFEVFTANLTGKRSYYVLISSEKDDNKFIVTLGILGISIIISMMLLNRNKRWNL